MTQSPASLSTVRVIVETIIYSLETEADRVRLRYLPSFARAPPSVSSFTKGGAEGSRRDRFHPQPPSRLRLAKNTWCTYRRVVVFNQQSRGLHSPPSELVFSENRRTY